MYLDTWVWLLLFHSGTERFVFVFQTDHCPYAWWFLLRPHETLSCNKQLEVTWSFLILHICVQTSRWYYISEQCTFTLLAVCQPGWYSCTLVFTEMILYFLEMPTWMILLHPCVYLDDTLFLRDAYLDDTPAPWQSLRCSVSGSCNQTLAILPPVLKTIKYADGNGVDQNEDDGDDNGLEIMQWNSSHKERWWWWRRQWWVEDITS